ncbi:MAG: alpha amylase C-terminal domain-containing protein [Bacteroidales bacterium]|jgi:1,4-alpha-glucan branching enzyme|nr:alpha amylase C-terminal domain-containing protein [Bacteroidales bacterium]
MTKLTNNSIKTTLNPLKDDQALGHYWGTIMHRKQKTTDIKHRLCGEQSLADFASGHEYFGLHKTNNGWTLREWAPNATQIFVIGDFSNWQEQDNYQMQKGDNGIWTIDFPKHLLKHEMLYRLTIHWDGGQGERIPAWCRREVQDDQTHIFSAQVWDTKPYQWKHPDCPHNEQPIIYEAHVGMSSEEEKVATWDEFRTQRLPQLVGSGYNTIQLMAVMEHPYYGSFGYHVSGFFALSSRFGTPEEFKALVDDAHNKGFKIIMDLVHSHAVKNEIEGLGNYDGTRYQFFHDGERGEHPAWDSYCFNYNKDEVLHFLLSNCRFWLDEYNVDGFRFDGITSMLYEHHGLGDAFDHYDKYFNDSVDEDAYCYLALANELIHTIRPDAITVAEDVSGMPGLGAPVAEGGCGFDYRLAMGITDFWFKLFDVADENWDMWHLWHELTNKRQDEATISYVECHDQAIVGGKSAIFTMADAEIYYNMHKGSGNPIVERAVALHKMTRLITVSTAGNGYLNFMGNEFGHPEWIDFPREGNDWSYNKSRRQWSLAEDDNLRFKPLMVFDRAMMSLMRERQIIDYRLQPLMIDNEKKILAFERGGLYFFFNFHPNQSYPDYSVSTLPGKYSLIINTDSPQFDGNGILTEPQDYFTRSYNTGSEINHALKIYLPCRSALVMERS